MKNDTYDRATRNRNIHTVGGRIYKKAALNEFDYQLETVVQFGDSDRFIGQQSEIRLRWDVIPKNIRFEAGAAYLFKEKFAKNAPNVSDEGDPNYLYTQLIFLL